MVLLLETGNGIEFVGDDGARTGGETGDCIEESEDRIAQAFNYVECPGKALYDESTTSYKTNKSINNHYFRWRY